MTFVLGSYVSNSVGQVGLIVTVRNRYLRQSSPPPCFHTERHAAKNVATTTESTGGFSLLADVELKTRLVLINTQYTSSTVNNVYKVFFYSYL